MEAEVWELQQGSDGHDGGGTLTAVGGWVKINLLIPNWNSLTQQHTERTTGLNGDAVGEVTEIFFQQN